MSYEVPGVADFLVGHLVGAVEDVREILRGGATLYEDKRGPVAPAIWVTMDWVMTSTRRVTVRAWAGLTEVARLDLRFEEDCVTQFDHDGTWENYPYAAGLEPLAASWRDQVAAGVQAYTERGEFS